VHILAAFFDPNDNGLDITDVSVLLGVFIVAWTAVWGAVRWNGKRVAAVRDRERAEMERRLAEQIKEATKPIQPDANGGFALADVVRTLDGIGDDVRYLRRRLDDHIDWHVENRDGRSPSG
jgi:hypothetical protein